MTADVVIVGGGVVGSSIAYHLRHDGFTGRVVVVERDSTYRRASSNLAMGGIRQQFGSPLNVRLAQYSVGFYKRFDQVMSSPARTVRSSFQPRGYLFLVNEQMEARFDRRVERQRRLGARVERVTVEHIRRWLPHLVLDDIRYGVFGPEDGYANPREILAGFREGAAGSGAEYLKGEVTGIQQHGGGVAGVVLEGSRRITSAVVVNAAGPFAARVGAMAGLSLPVQPVRQQLFRCALPHVWPYRFPMVVDPTGVHWRHEDPDSSDARDRIMVALTNLDEPPGENFACDMVRWDDEFHPPLARRLPDFDRLDVIEGWAGLYEMTPDHNPILGEHPALRGFFLANGFSGHGLMMAPATGKVLSDLIRLGRSELADVSEFDVTRFDRGEYFLDEAMI